MEGEFSFQEHLFKGELTGKYLGEESMLTIPALSLEINNLFLSNQESAPIFEYLEEIRKEQSLVEIHNFIKSLLGNTKNKLTIARTKKRSIEQDEPLINQPDQVGKYQCDFCGSFVAIDEMFVI